MGRFSTSVMVASQDFSSMGRAVPCLGIGKETAGPDSEPIMNARIVSPGWSNS